MIISPSGRHANPLKPRSFLNDFFYKKDWISVLKSPLTLCPQNTKCFTQRLHPIGGAQGTSDYIRMHFTTWGKISCSLLVGIWFQQVTPQKPFRMICEPFGTKNFKVSSPSKCIAAEISGSNLAVASFANGWNRGERCVSSSHRRKKLVLAQMRKSTCNVWEDAKKFSTGLRMGELHCASFLRPMGNL